MRMLLLTQYYPPEIGAPQTRLLAMSRELRRLGHDVEVVTALPNYPTGQMFPGYGQTIYRHETRDGIEIHRVWLFPAMGSGLRRIFNYLSFTLTSFYGLLRAKRPDFVFVESPPLPLAIPGWVFARLWRVPFILNVADLWPDSAVEMGLLRSRLAIRILLALERWSYRRADLVNAITEGVRESLLLVKNVPPGKVLFLPNGVDTAHYRPRPVDIGLKQTLGLEGKRVVLYQGTLGHAHGLEVVLRAAKLLEDRPDIHFLFMGDGSERARLEGLRQDLGLRNVSFHNPVSVEQLPPYFSIAECGLASIRSTPLLAGARPAKMFPVLASGKPLILVGKGEAADLVQHAGAGIVVAPGNPSALATAVTHLFANPELSQTYGRNGRNFVESNLQWTALIGDWAARLAALQLRSQAGSATTRA